jgi:hypothetical protein
MSHSTHSARSASGLDLWIWWQTLTDDQQELLRITGSTLPFAPHVIFLAWTECPLVSPRGGGGPSTVVDPEALSRFIQQS